MKKLAMVFLGIFTLLFFVSPASSFAQSESQINKDVVILSKDDVVNKDYFAAGGINEVHGVVNGDAYIVGGQVTFDGTINGDLIVGGGTVYVAGKVDGNLRVAGGQVMISGEVTKNVTALGGTVEILNSAVIDGSLTSAAGNININAPVEKGANIASGNLTINNIIGGDLTAHFGSLRATSNARINGDFDYWTQEQDDSVSIDQNAFISGAVRKHEIASMGAPSKKEVSNFMSGIRTMFGFSSFVTTLVVGFILLRFAPKFVVKSSDMIRERFLYSILMGILAFIVSPIVIILLFITILGIPLAMISAFVFMIMVYVSRVFAIVTLGGLIIDKLMKEKKSMSWKFVSGLVVYYILGVVPFLGGIVKFLVVTSGLGASVTGFRKV